MTTCRYINSGKSNYEFEYIGEFETEFFKCLEYESGAHLGVIDRKKQRAKISCYCPFKVTLCIRYIDLHSFHSVYSKNTNIFTLHMWLRTQSFILRF